MDEKGVSREDVEDSQERVCDCGRLYVALGTRVANLEQELADLQAGLNAALEQLDLLDRWVRPQVTVVKGGQEPTPP
ncbi:MAG: hypothetical protein JXA37_11325 [Chloroflexia bacterium]|nr:hypothetical protein [Chloroflexia bacterium]